MLYAMEYCLQMRLPLNGKNGFHIKCFVERNLECNNIFESYVVALSGRPYVVVACAGVYIDKEKKELKY